ncbi:hypothetical protein [Acidovorax sp. NCPPB 4044]|uniref:hypothetical protein n=1 Tax=Acidovorax sp. NCPPB 4044 TaxID=2940490 RepID=UPI0023048F10|nr:hypothetical protein [Acidovorax sp. NCPPB 4044]MDA8522173.1 hypothetical protein [Acidovorax sp. NCPPB 4044]
MTHPQPRRRLHSFAKSIPLLLLLSAIAIYTLASLASATQELLPRWLKAYEYMPPFLAYVLLGCHALLTPGAGLLAYALPLLKWGDDPARLKAGAMLWLYYPARIFLLFILIGFFPLWLVFELVELLVFARWGRRAARKLRPSA